MKRTLQVVGGLGLAAAVTLGAPAAAQAGTHHKDSRSAAKSGHAAAERVHHCATAKRCRPKPLPKPTNGWPCAKDHSCKTRHHRPICKPPVRPPHHKPPVPPILHDAPKPPVLQRVTVADALPRTGPADVPVYLLAAGGLIGSGTFLRRLARVR